VAWVGRRAKLENFSIVSGHSAQNTLDPLRLLGARYGRLDNRCDYCKKHIDVILLAVMKQTPPKRYRNIYIFCKKCLSAHSSLISWYLYLNQ